MNKPRTQKTLNYDVHYVYGRRARKLRRRGEEVRPFGNNSRGRTIFVWFRQR